MNFIDKSADSIAKSIRRNYPEAGSEIALKYSLILVINTLSSMSVILLISAITGHLSQALLVIFAYSLLRYFSGGAHMYTSLSCNIASTIMLTVLSHISFPYEYSGILLTAMASIIIIIYAPDGLEKVSRIDPKYYPLLKVISLVIVCSNFYFQSSVLSAVFITQAFTITKLAYKMIDYMERRK